MFKKLGPNQIRDLLSLVTLAESSQIETTQSVRATLLTSLGFDTRPTMFGQGVFEYSWQNHYRDWFYQNTQIRSSFRSLKKKGLVELVCHPCLTTKGKPKGRYKVKITKEGLEYYNKLKQFVRDPLSLTSPDDNIRLFATYLFRKTRDV